METKTCMESMLKRIEVLEEKMRFFMRDEADRLVEGLPNKRFIDNGNGTVTDTKTNLMWWKKGTDIAYDWQQAVGYCKDLAFYGHSDWRLPTIEELFSIIDHGRHDPAINPVFKCKSSNYWSSTTYTDYPSNAWYVYFSYGGVHNYSKSYGSYVRAVRGGQWLGIERNYLRG